jgi:ligand-binding sensor domain-containing protein
MNRFWHPCPVRHLAALTLTPFVISGVVAFGSAVGLVAQIPIAQMYHKLWTVRDGAPNNINGIATGADGFLWLASDDGL